MEITVNGDRRHLSGPLSLQELVRSLELREDRVALELNRQIVRRERWTEIQLQDQDSLEIVQFVGGG